MHMEYYRLPDNIMEVTKVGRLLIAAEETKFKRGKKITIEDIDVDEIEPRGDDIEEEREESNEVHSDGDSEEDQDKRGVKRKRI